MVETQKLKKEVIELSCILLNLTEYESLDLAIKILALEEQRKANDILADIANELSILRTFAGR
jgi:hypothetical protein